MLASDLRDRRDDGGRLDRLGQMLIESGEQRALTILVAGICGERDHRHVTIACGAKVTHGVQQIESVTLGHRDV